MSLKVCGEIIRALATSEVSMLEPHSSLRASGGHSGVARAATEQRIMSRSRICDNAKAFIDCYDDLIVPVML